MSPQPRKQNPQRQPLTTSLRKICRDYPAGAGVFNELLQNADDAGASTVRFALDTNYYPETPVLVDGLSEFQGPALLAFNDAKFTEDDFASLTSLGDSKKLQKKDATGKFGLGFCSSFNWTDCPSIISGSTLLFLDPHHSWSRVFDIPGGPEYDFIADSGDKSMMNQLQCFSLFNKDWDHPFDGTIIRLPLRTSSHAQRSEISKKTTTIDDIKYSMDSFANEIGSEGLLFLRSVQRIVLAIDNDCLNEVEIINGKDLVMPREQLRKVLDNELHKNHRNDTEIYHEVHLRHWTPTNDVVNVFGVLNLVVASTDDRELEHWAVSDKLFPWVAVAAPLKQAEGSIKCGRLFSILPLPISTGLPVNIHSLFSMSADRSRLHGFDRNGVQDQRPERWNKYLFEIMVPHAWAKLLANIAQNNPVKDFFQLWPTNASSPQELWHGVCPAVFAQVIERNLAVWFTETGYVSLPDGLVASDQISVERKKMLHETKLAIIILPKNLFSVGRQHIEDQILQPRTLCERLRKAEAIEDLSTESRAVLLDFLLPEVPLANLRTLKIFPFEDGEFHSLQKVPVFWNRDDVEKNLFIRQRHMTIATDRLSESSRQILHDKLKHDHQIIRHRTSSDLRGYVMEYFGHASDDFRVFDDQEKLMLKEIWKWILQHGEKQLNLSTLGSLWLVPLQSSGVRKLVPTDRSNMVTWFRSSQARAVSLRIIAVDPEKAPKILAETELSHEAAQRLLFSAKNNPNLCIEDGQKFLEFLRFTVRGRSLLRAAGDDVKNSVLHTLTQMYLAESPELPDFVYRDFRTLHIFKAVQWPSNAADCSATKHRTDLTGDFEFFGLRRLVPIPPTARQVLIDATDEGDRKLLEELGRLNCLEEVQILERIVIPALKNGLYERLNPELRREAVILLFRNYYHISNDARDCLSNLFVVPMRIQSGDNAASFGLPSDVLDPRKPELANLYFEDEIRYPEASFYDLFREILVRCGMTQLLNKRVVLNRIQVYQRRQIEFETAAAARAKNLLQMQLQSDGAQFADFANTIRQQSWLPVKMADESFTFINAAECRDMRDKVHVGHVWSILSFHVHDSWKSILGWHDCIGVDVLMTQVCRAIAASDVHSVEQTLEYLRKCHAMESYASRLLDLDFVRSVSGKLVSAAIVCRGGADRLDPYLHMVEHRFLDDNSQLLELAEVPDLPTREQLKNVQRALKVQEPLSEEDLEVAIELAIIWSARFRDTVDGLRLPTIKCVLADISDLSYNDVPWSSEDDHVILHSKISRTVAAQLRIPCLSEKLRHVALGIAGTDDDEFYQREEVADGIKDTLSRYTRESTFHEYIANSDDCGSASDVNFLFDGRTHSTDKVLTKELEDLQGPSLLIHNNGVFTEDDFNGLKHVGRGSKRSDPTTIGKFGRGSQTMYHWTDVPMILSGKYLLILDPLRRYLPYNYRTRERKPGIKVEYAKLKSVYPDQLAPFEDAWGFDSSQSFYQGTIFRFPLRKDGEDSELLEALRCPDISTVIEIFRNSLDEARLALLFLRNIAKIDFSVKGCARRGNSEWSVRRGEWPENADFSGWANIIVLISDDRGRLMCTTERWWRVIADVPDAPAHLQHRHKKMMKHVECGIAALVPPSKEVEKSPLRLLKSKFFNYLPLYFNSTLPVQIHATFLLSGDRQNIAIEETSQDAGSEWNRWLLENRLPKLYLQFLEDLGRKINSEVYTYFPVVRSSNPDLLSDLIRSSFWRKIQSSTCRLFPGSQTRQELDSTTIPSRSLRTEPMLITFEQSVFDLLDEQKFKTLRRLIFTFHKGVVRLPLEIREHIKDVPNVKTLTPAIVRDTLRSARPADVENAIQMDKDFLGALLSLITPQNTEEVIDLNGCPVLPLASGNVGILSLRSNFDDNKNTPMYFSAGTECQKLFSFALPIFCTQKENARFVEEILESGLLNLKRIEKNDISQILAHKESPKSPCKAWLTSFWEYMNETTHTQASSDEPTSVNWDLFLQFPLVSLRDGNNRECVASLHYFQNEPAVVQSTHKDHAGIFADFPGLLIADSKTLPTEYREAETSLDDSSAMKRFLRSIAILAERDAKAFTEYVKANLKPKNIKTAQKILTKALAKDTLELPDIARDLPVWESVSAKHGYLTAREAIMAQTRAFIVPWIKNYHRFTISVEPFHMNTIDDISMLQQYVIPTLPKSLDESTKPSYVKLIAAIKSKMTLTQKAKNDSLSVTSLQDCRLAAGQDCVLYHAYDLYDHNDEIFSAAFRHQGQCKFLMLEIRNHQTLWHELGLRSRKSGRYKGADYLRCLEILEDRLIDIHDGHLESDVTTILHPLCTIDGSLDNVDPSNWSIIAGLQVFPVRKEMSNQPQYRRHHMEHLASQTKTLCLRKIIRYENVAVCWSQTPFVLQEPTSQSCRSCGANGKPTCLMVWKHLAFLAQLAQTVDEAHVERYMDDLQQTYQYLSVNLQESKDTFSMTTAAIWLNVEFLDIDVFSAATIRSSWTTLENLLLDTPCDALPLQAVQPFLGRFRTLLKELGCRSIVYPQVTSSRPDRSNGGMSSVKNMWKEDILTDVSFKAEGKTISAHKVILASRSLYCKTQFSGPWASSPKTSGADEVIDQEEMCHAALEILIGFCYEENLDWAAKYQVTAPNEDLSSIADKLDMLLEVLAAADRWIMPDLHADAQSQVVNGIKFFVRSDNVGFVRKVADEANATELRAYCDAFASCNAEAVFLATA